MRKTLRKIADQHAVMFLANNILKTTIHPDQIVAETLLMVIISNLITGFYEEIILRCMLLGHMMKHWKNDEKKILRSAAVTSILFGVVHLGNLAYGNTAETIFQVFYATILGMIFAASYLLFERKIYGRAYLFMEL